MSKSLIPAVGGRFAGGTISVAAEDDELLKRKRKLAANHDELWKRWRRTDEERMTLRGVGCKNDGKFRCHRNLHVLCRLVNKPQITYITGTVFLILAARPAPR